MCACPRCPGFELFVYGGMGWGKPFCTCAALPGAWLGPRAWGADAGEGANEVLAQHAPGVAVLLTVCTLAHICG